MITRNVHALFTTRKAETLVETLKSDDPDWAYKVERNPSNPDLSIIAVFDEDAEFVGYL